ARAGARGAGGGAGGARGAARGAGAAGGDGLSLDLPAQRPADVDGRRARRRSRTYALLSSRSDARSPIMSVGAFVLPVVTNGITEASATRRPSTPWTRSSGSTTDVSSQPIRHVPTWW